MFCVLVLQHCLLEQFIAASWAFYVNLRVSEALFFKYAPLGILADYPLHLGQYSAVGCFVQCPSLPLSAPHPSLRLPLPLKSLRKPAVLVKQNLHPCHLYTLRFQQPFLLVLAVPLCNEPR